MGYVILGPLSNYIMCEIQIVSGKHETLTNVSFRLNHRIRSRPNIKPQLVQFPNLGVVILL